MSTLIASRSAHLVQPGLALLEPDERLDGPFWRPAPSASVLSSHGPDVSLAAGTSAQTDDLHTREVAWACEWWPPD